MNGKPKRKITVDDFELADVDEEEVMERRSRSRDFDGKRRGPGCSPKLFASLGCFAILALCLVGIWMAATRPSGLWQPVVNFINNNVEYPNPTLPTIEETQTAITSQVTDVGENEVIITEDQLTTLAKNKFPNLRDLNLQIEEGKILIYWKLDASEEPIFAYSEVSLDENKTPYIIRTGTPKIQVPEALNSALNNLLKSILNFTGENGVVSSILPGSEQLEISKIEMQKDKLLLKTKVNIDIFSQ